MSSKKDKEPAKADENPTENLSNQDSLPEEKSPAVSDADENPTPDDESSLNEVEKTSEQTAVEPSSITTPVKFESPRAAPQSENFESTTEKPAESIIEPTSAAEETSSVFATEAVMPTASKSKHRMTGLVILVIAFVIMFTAGAAAYFGIIAPNKPENVVKAALANTFDPNKIKSLSYEGDINLGGQNIPAGIEKITFNGVVSEGGAATLNVSANIAVTTVQVSLLSLDENALFVKVSGLAGLDTLLGSSFGGQQGALAKSMAPIIKQFNDQWIKVDGNLLKQAAGGSTQALTKTTSLSEADSKKLADAYKAHPFIKVVDKLEDQTIHGVPSYHFVVAINKDELKAFAANIQAANIEAFQMSQADWTNIQEQINKINTDNIVSEVWVSKSDKRFTQFKITYKNGKESVAVRLAIKEVNQPVNLEAPKNTKTVLELLGAAAPLLNQLQTQGVPTGFPALTQ